MIAISFARRRSSRPTSSTGFPLLAGMVPVWSVTKATLEMRFKEIPSCEPKKCFCELHNTFQSHILSAAAHPARSSYCRSLKTVLKAILTTVAPALGWR